MYWGLFTDRRTPYSPSSPAPSPSSSLTVIHCDNLSSLLFSRSVFDFCAFIFLSDLMLRNVPSCNCVLRQRVMEHEMKVLLLTVNVPHNGKTGGDLCIGYFISVTISHLWWLWLNWDTNSTMLRLTSFISTNYKCILLWNAQWNGCVLHRNWDSTMSWHVSPFQTKPC